MWADAEADVDFLNYSEVAELVAELIGDQNLLPLSLGIFGGWGTGKSTVLRLVEHELERAPDRYLIVKFDAWLYQDFDDARAALMGVIASALVEASPPTLKEKAKSLLGRVNKLRLLGLAVEGGALAMGVPTFGVLARGVEAAGDVLGARADAEDAKALKEAAADVQGKAKGLIAPEQKKGPPEEIDAFRQEFGQLLEGLGRTLVVFIDNLDRCLPPNAIHTLEAVRLFLFMPNTAFVIAADEDMIRHAVTQHFNNPSERHVADYLDKLIQMPVRVPRVGVQEVRAYLFLLLAARSRCSAAQCEALRDYLIKKLRLSWKAEGAFTVDDVLGVLGAPGDEPLRQSLDMADRMAPVLAHSSRVMGNPRIVKRMLNVVRMRASIARKRSMPLDEALITKLALFERCTDQAATEALHNAINEAREGKPNILRELEDARIEATKSPPEAWAKHMTFLREWAGLEPQLSGIDLRPAVYLARETVPLRIAGASISSASRSAVETLLKVSSVSSQAARNAIKAVPSEEMVPVMEAIISEMRKNSDWSRARSDFRGAFVLAQHSPDAAALLARFVRSLQLQRNPAWLSAMLKDTGLN